MATAGCAARRDGAGPEEGRKRRYRRPGPPTGRIAAGSAEAAPASRSSPAIPAGVTPSMAQFLEIKAANPDCLLFYRMGDFYELFFEDAVAAADALGIVLTKRGKHLGEDIPMCGVPIHRADEYLQRLIAKRLRVAVCEQLEDPAEARKRGSKAVVHRDVVRLVTPGTLTEDSLLDAKARNYLTALFKAPHSGGRGDLALASLDISTGEFEVGRNPGRRFPGRDRAALARRGDRRRHLARRRRFRQWIGIAGAAATPVRRALRQPRRRAAAEIPARRCRPGSVRRVLAAGAGRRRRPAQICRADPDRQEALLAPAAPQRTSRSPRHRCADAVEPGTSALDSPATGNRACSPPSTARVTGPGARELAARLGSPLARPRSHCRPARCASASCTTARHCARTCGAPPAHTRPGARIVAAGPAARLAARSRRR